MLHILVHRLEPILLHQLAQQDTPLMIRRHLGPQVRFNALEIPTPRAPLPPRGQIHQQMPQPVRIERSIPDKPKRNNLRPFLEQGRTRRGHAPARDTPDISMMPAGSREEDDL